jgi:hypothetical protein
MNSFVLTTNIPKKRQVRNKIPFTIISKRIKYLEINSTKKVKNTENYKNC